MLEHRPEEMGKQANCFQCKPEDLSLIPETHRKVDQRKEPALKVVLHMHFMAHADTQHMRAHARTHTNNR